MKSLFKFSLLMLLFMIGIAEISMRWMGGVDFPIYQVDDKIGYVPAPNQQGHFLNKNDWFLNNRSLGTSGKWPEDSLNKNNIMLVGDSVVWGGNPLKHQDKLGPQLETALGKQFKVWSAAAGGWSVANEIEMVNRNNDIYQAAKNVVWLINSGDITILSETPGNLVHPARPVRCATCFYTQKYILPKIGISLGMENPSIDTDAGINEQIWKKFYSVAMQRIDQDKSITFVIYPNVEELNKNKIQGYVKLQMKMRSICSLEKVSCIDLSEEKSWSKSLYRDGIHPSIKGNSILTNIIKEKII